MAYYPSSRPQQQGRLRRSTSSLASAGSFQSRAGIPKNGDGKFHDYRGFFLLLCGAVVLWLNLSFLKSLVMGAIFAIVLYPLMLRMARWRVSTTLKATLVTLGFTVAFLIPVGILIFLGAQAALEKVQSLQQTIEQSGISTWSLRGILDILGIEGLVDRLLAWFPLDETQLRQLATRGLQVGGTLLANLLQNLIADVPAVLFSTLVILFTIFYLLIDGKKAVQFLSENSFFNRRSTEYLLTTMYSLCYSVVVASVVSAVVQTTLIGIACVITRTPNIALIALVTFIFSFLPVIGTAPVTLFLTASAFLSGHFSAGIIFAVFMFLIGISDNIVRPYVLRGGANLHPLIGFVAAFGALEAIGFYGLFIGPVVAGLFFQVLPLVTKSYSRSRI